MKILNPKQSIIIAGREHAEAIRQIYRLVQIDPAHLLELAELSNGQPVPANLIRILGGFISPPDERDMELTLENGMVLICIEDGEVVGYNRYITQAETVYQELCTEFNVDPSLREFSCSSFADWSGDKEKQAGKTLKKVHWIDRELASLTFNAALAGLENRPVGRQRLAWSVDTAVHPESRNRGIANAIVDRVNSELNPEFGFRCSRIFEIRKINDREVCIENTCSKNTFINSSFQQFAYTEEEVMVNSGVTLLVRWNHWLKQT